MSLDQERVLCVVAHFSTIGSQKMSYLELFQPFDGKTIEDLANIVRENGLLRLRRYARAMIANDVYNLSRAAGKPLRRDETAKLFDISRQLLQQAACIDRTSSAAIKRSVRGGSLSLHKAVEAFRAAEKETGIKATKTTSDSDMKTLQKKQQNILDHWDLVNSDWTFYKNKRALEAGLDAMRRMLPTFTTMTALLLTPLQKARLLTQLNEVVGESERLQEFAPVIRRWLTDEP